MRRFAGAALGAGFAISALVPLTILAGPATASGRAAGQYRGSDPVTDAETVAVGHVTDRAADTAAHAAGHPAGALGGTVKCWEAGGITLCMWADNGTYGVFDYRPPLGLDTALIHHLAGVVPPVPQGHGAGAGVTLSHRGSRSSGLSRGKP